MAKIIDFSNRVHWEDFPSESTPITAENLNQVNITMGEVVEAVNEHTGAISKLEESIADLEESGIGGSGGQPIVVKTADSMTDTTAIYLYMGDGETVDSVEYTKGYIYTYDADTAKWVNSGLYGKGQDGKDGQDGEDGQDAILPDNTVLYEDTSEENEETALPVNSADGTTFYFGVDNNGVPFVGNTSNEVVWTPSSSGSSEYANGDEVEY